MAVAFPWLRAQLWTSSSQFAAQSVPIRCVETDFVTWRTFVFCLFLCDITKRDLLYAKETFSMPTFVFCLFL